MGKIGVRMVERSMCLSEFSEKGTVVREEVVSVAGLDDGAAQEDSVMSRTLSCRVRWRTCFSS